VIEKGEWKNEKKENNKDELCKIDDIYGIFIDVELHSLEKPYIFLRKNILEWIVRDRLSKNAVEGGLLEEHFDHIASFYYFLKLGPIACSVLIYEFHLS
jgi:hypothetical protein